MQKSLPNQNFDIVVAAGVFLRDHNNSSRLTLSPTLITQAGEITRIRDGAIVQIKISTSRINNTSSSLNSQFRHSLIPHWELWLNN